MRLRDTGSTLEDSGQEHEKYASLMRIARDGIHLLDETGLLVDANPSFLRKIGHGEEAIGAVRVHDWDVGIPQHELLPMLRAILDEPRLFETRYRRPDGTEIDVEVQAGGIELRGRRYLIAAARDITPRKRLLDELAQKQRQLEELNASLEQRVQEAVADLRKKDQLLITQGRLAAMGEMLNNIAHQWRQPLNALSLTLANIKDAATPGEVDLAVIERAVAVGSRLVKKMSTTINDFSNFVRTERTGRPFDVDAKVRETVSLMEAAYRHLGIAIEVTGGCPCPLNGFANEYSQVLLNLLGNAKEAIESTGRGWGRITLGLEEREGRVRLTVRDDGGGIPEAVLDKIFEPYFSTKPGGSGIGLYMSRQIVERSFGGTITARNVDGGAELTVDVPLSFGA